MTVIRLAVPADEDRLYDLLMALAEDQNYTFGHELDEESIRDHIRLGTNKTRGMHFVVDGRNGELAACCLIVWSQYWFTKQFHLEQTVFFVRPEYRRSRIADDLMRHVRAMHTQFERDNGAPVQFVNMVVSQNDLARKLAFWRRHSGPMIGGIFLLE